MPPFGRKGQLPQCAAQLPPASRIERANLPIPILVPRSSVTPDAACHHLAYSVVKYVNHALHECAFTRDELPVEAMWAFHVDYYITQVNNGGHGQFAHNSGWHDSILNDIKNGLSAIKDQRSIELFDSFVTFSILEPARFERVVNGAGIGNQDDFVKNLDSLFYAGIGDDAASGLRRWLEKNSALRVVDDDQYQNAMAEMASRNPVRNARLIERKKEKRAELEADPLYLALNHICRLTPGNIRFERCISAHPQGELGGTVFRAITNVGVCQIFIFPDSKAGLIVGNEDSPRSKIPFQMVNAYLQREGFEAWLPETKRGQN